MMTKPSWSRAVARLNMLLATIGLAIVSILSLPVLATNVRAGLGAGLVVIWCCFVWQLIRRILARQRADTGARTAALAGDILSVLVPLAGLFAGFDDRDKSLFCGIWLVKLLQSSAGFRLVASVLAREARNLFTVLSIFGIVLFVAALAAHVLERTTQPDTFDSIPKAMWWAVVTLSTTGYGDAIPQSVAGRILAGVVMLSGIGVFALWAAILASGFSAEVQRQDFVRNWQLISAVPLFQRLGGAELVEIVRVLRLRNLSAGAVICRKGEPGDHMFFIVEGHVRVRTTNHVELGPGNFFGEYSLVTGEPRSATVVASTAVSLLSLHTSDFQNLMGRNPDVAEAIRQTVHERRGVEPKT